MSTQKHIFHFCLFANYFYLYAIYTDILLIILYIQNKKGRDRLKNLKLKSARVALDLSQEQLAQKVGVTRQTIGMIEAGKYNPTINLCIAICKVLGKTLDDLFWTE